MPGPSAMRRLAAFLAGVLWGAASCSAPEPDPQQALADDIRVTYRRFLEKEHIAYAVMTYPESIGALPVAKQIEFRTVQGVLDELHVPYTGMRHDEALVEFEGRQPGTRRLGYFLSEGLAERYRGRSVLFLNLGLGAATPTTSHPNCAKYGVLVKVVTDPVDFGPVAGAAS